MILDNDKIFRICNRLAYQIIEESNQSDKILLVGIKEKGFLKDFRGFLNHVLFSLKSPPNEKPPRDT